MLNWLRTKLNKRFGVIINTNNSVYINDGKFLNIKIPLEELEKFGLGIEPGKENIYQFKNGETIRGILEIVTINKNKPGFTIMLPAPIEDSGLKIQ